MKVEGKKEHFGILYFIISRKVKPEVQKKLCTVYGESAVTASMCPKWFVKFHAGDFSLMMLHSRKADLLKATVIK